MLPSVSFSSLVVSSVISVVFIGLCIFLNIQIRRLRLKMNILLEEKAKALEEADHYAQLAKNPLGPLFSQNTEPCIISFDAKGKIISVNTTLLQKFGYTKTQLIGKNIIGTILPKAKKITEDIVYRLFKNPTLFTDTETQTQTKSGENIWISWTNKINYNDKGKPISANAVGFDVTKRKEMEAQLQYLSSIDPQTGVLNRPALLQTATTELKRAKRYKRDLSVVAIKFHQNATGTSLSDTQLKEAINIVRQVVRSVDYLGRAGDTEFTLILPETAEKNVPFLMQRLNQYIQEYNKKKNSHLLLSYVATSYTKKSDTIDNLLSQALRKVNQKNKRGTL